MLELPADTLEEVRRLSAAGDADAKRGQLSEAVAKYWAAWDLLPEPRTEWEAATWLLAAIGDANFRSGDFAVGRDNLSKAMRCPSGSGNAFLHARLGQCQFELGAHDSAAEELMRAYMAAGSEIFAEEHPKYLRFLGSRAKGVQSPKKAWEFWK
ncbi:tetratricopeptide repeat protein [Ramlibacter sp. WS9]|nr:tetratricopeptide repeat protein [Ramlibacter sp. WS9]